jgi:hypothetical protein
VAATRLLATAGAGGIALTAWALRRSGMSRRALVSGLTTFYVALYAISWLRSYWPARDCGPESWPAHPPSDSRRPGALALLAFGVDTGLTVAVVLSYRAFA